jgi:hypothetical protein
VGDGERLRREVEKNFFKGRDICRGRLGFHGKEVNETVV